MSMGKLSVDMILNGIVLAVGGILIASLRNIPYKLYSAIRRTVVVTLVVDSRSELFSWLIAHLNDLPYSKSCRLLTASATPDTLHSKSGQKGNSTLLVTPAPGFHVFLDGYRLVWATRELSAGQQIIETVRMSTFGFKRRYFDELLAKCVDRIKNANIGRTPLYMVDRWAESWILSSVRTNRPLSTVILDGDAQGFCADIANFLRSEEWYARRGIPWRRGYLLYGPPGTGKTSLIIAAAGELNMSLCMLSLSDTRLSDHSFSVLLQRTPSNSMIVIEDVDAFFCDRSSVAEGVKLSFSGFLNALDGVHSLEGRVIVLTTNHVDRLDSALIRPGRVDRQFHLEYATHAQIYGMYIQFFPDDTQGADRFLKQIGDRRVSPAYVQEVLLGMASAKGFADE